MVKNSRVCFQFKWRLFLPKQFSFLFKWITTTYSGRLIPRKFGKPTIVGFDGHLDFRLESIGAYQTWLAEFQTKLNVIKDKCDKDPEKFDLLLDIMHFLFTGMKTVVADCLEAGLEFEIRFLCLFYTNFFIRNFFAPFCFGFFDGVKQNWCKKVEFFFCK